MAVVLMWLIQVEENTLFSQTFFLMEGYVPDGLKTVVVTNLIKKATLPADNLNNYRPVSGLSFIVLNEWLLISC